MLTQAPLPGWANLFRALVRHPLPDADLAAPWRRHGEVAGWLSRSAWSMALIALWRKNCARAAQVTIWLPDYFCNSSLGALRRTGAQLVFYPLDTNMAPDMAACRTMMASNPPDLFLLVHYFGLPRAVAPARDFCRQTGAWLIEDAVHVLRPVAGVGESGDFVLYSPHKHFPIPDGSVLVLRPDGPGRVGSEALASFGSEATWPGQLHALQRDMRDAVLNSELRAVVWLVKRVLQKLGVRSWRPALTAFAESLDPGLSVVTQLTAPSRSGLARRLLAVALPELGDVARLRQRRQLLWDTLLVGDEIGRTNKVVVADRATGRDWTPYLGAYSADAATSLATYEKWQRLGLPVTTWPDLPPEVMNNQERHTNALHFRHTRFYLQVHQTLSVRGMLKQCRPLRPIQVSEPCLRLVWDDASPAQWLQYVAQAGRSNLLQSWAYGEAKADDSGWRVRRGIFHRGNEPIALVQLLQKRVAGVLLISRINRAPLLLKPCGAEEQRAIWGALAGLGSLWRGKVLAVAPELELSGSNLATMGVLGFRQFSPRAWESVWLDLRMNLHELRKRLDGKWRNMLTFSEKSGLTLDTRRDALSFEWMMTRYQDLMREKDFTGPPISLLRSLSENLSEKAQPIIMRAMHNEEAVAAICLVTHGAAATYLLGWNGPVGRRLKANQFLLWQAVAHLKQLGFDWFDLGGISEENAGITAFKRGMGGERYELVGEYWKW
jgi:hypothetical protein